MVTTYAMTRIFLRLVPNDDSWFLVLDPWLKNHGWSSWIKNFKLAEHGLLLMTQEYASFFTVRVSRFVIHCSGTNEGTSWNLQLNTTCSSCPGSPSWWRCCSSLVIPSRLRLDATPSTLRLIAILKQVVVKLAISLVGPTWSQTQTGIWHIVQQVNHCKKIQSKMNVVVKWY